MTGTALVTDLRLWHARLAHVHVNGIQDMVKKNIVSGIDGNMKQDIALCESCIYGKSCRAPIPKQKGDRSKGILDLAHSDAFGPLNMKSIGGSKYFVTFIDNHSRFVVVYTMKENSEAFSCFKKWLATVERHTNCKLKAIRCDNGGEYVSKDFDDFLGNHGIERDPTVPYNPHQNGVAERLNRTLMELVRAMLHYKSIPKRFWAEALSVAVYIRNRVTTRGLSGNVTPFEMWNGRKPNLNHLRVFGSRCWYTVRTTLPSKLDARAREAILIGYARRTQGYKLWDESKKKVVVSRDVKFDELGVSENAPKEDNDLLPDDIIEVDDIHQSPSSSKQLSDTDDEQPEPSTNVESEDSSKEVDVNEASNDPKNTSENSTDQLQTLRRSSRTRRAPGSWSKSTALTSAEIHRDPDSYKEATSSAEAQKWEQGMPSEYDSLVEHETWVLEPRPLGQNVVSNRWVFVTKDEVNEQGEDYKRYKARLVARGFSQVEGVDYNETYAPVVKFTSVRILMAIVTVLNLYLHQMDVVTAFLNGDLEETVYMEQPEGFKVKGKEDWVCRLRKAIYGLKQASRQWYKKMDDFLTKNLGLCRNLADDCIYTGCYDGVIVIIALYVDDLLIACSKMSKLNEIKAELSKRFRMKDLNEARKCLGFEISRDTETGKMFLSQSKYAQKVISRFGMESAKGCLTPMEVGLNLEQESESAVDAPYREAIGSLMYLMVGTRPDIAFAVSKLAKYVENPTVTQWKAVKRLLRYVIKTMEYGIWFCADNALEPFGYVDSDWAGDVIARKSTSGYVFVMGGGAVSWCSRQQEVVALSSTEAEYISLCSGMKEAIWLKRLVSDLGINPGLASGAMRILVDNQGSMDLARNGSTNRRTKHIDIRYHFCRQVLMDKLVSLEYCPGQENGADGFTKALGHVMFEKRVQLFGLVRRS